MAAFNCKPSLEVPGVFLDISTAFDKVRFDSLIYKVNKSGSYGSLCKFI